jgi:hypothetical protein
LLAYLTSGWGVPELHDPVRKNSSAADRQPLEFKEAKPSAAHGFAIRVCRSGQFSE